MIMAVGATFASLARLRKVRGAVSFDLPALTSGLGRAASRERLAEMRDAMQSETESWEGELLRLAIEAREPDQRAALVNEVLGDVGSDLQWGSRIPMVAARLSVVGPLAVLFFALAMQSAGLVDIVPVLAWGGVGVLAALAIGREADRVATETRTAVDAWVARVMDAAARS